MKVIQISATDFITFASIARISIDENDLILKFDQDDNIYNKSTAKLSNLVREESLRKKTTLAILEYFGMIIHTGLFFKEVVKLPDGLIDYLELILREEEGTKD